MPNTVTVTITGAQGQPIDTFTMEGSTSAAHMALILRNAVSGTALRIVREIVPPVMSNSICPKCRVRYLPNVGQCICGGPR